MAKRKLVGLGINQKCVYCSIPALYAQHLGLKPGMEVNVKLLQDSILVTGVTHDK